MRKICSLVFGLGVFLFFWLVLPYHLRFHEQYQFFRFGTDYFMDSVLHPEGFSFYLGGFFTQFFRYPWAGALIIALLLVLMQRLVAWISYGVTRRVADSARSSTPGNTFLYPLTFLPSAFVWLLLCNENYMISAVVALLLALGAVNLYQRAGDRKSRIAVFYILQPVLFFLAGGTVLIFTACFMYLEALRIGSRGRWKTYALRVFPAVALVFLYPVIARVFWQYPYEKLLGGIHFYRYYYFSYPLQYVAWALAAAVPLLCRLIPAPKPGSLHRLIPAPGTARLNRIISPALWVLLAAATVAGLYHFADRDKELLFAYDTLVYEEQWDQVLQRAQKDSPGSSIEMVAVNLALWKTGRLETELFHYPQQGPEGLMLPSRRDFVTPLMMSEVYLHLGMVNSAQRNAYDAMEAIPDFQKSARCYQRLAQTNIINGHYRVARTYLEQLSKTVFYRKWAQDAMQCLGNEGQHGGEARLGDEDRFGDDPLYGRIRRIRYRDEILFSPQGLNAMLDVLYRNNRENKMAYAYMLAYTLLAKDLERFADYITLEYPAGGDQPLPVPYQEALVLYWVQNNPSLEGIPWNISGDVSKKLDDFTAMYQQFAGGRPEQALKKDFGKTYWYYVFFTKI
ncbi:MAG: DUF6057 family protein [Bacteroidales bacterium]|nr:DUF6057 family protein [Bacteroidales bacterium]MDD3522224.1 DUF6057 family protein [Bacteroidales bacterium]MDD4031281.1 DUF6057 family protein [Bacteroidales bacterium]MDD4436365.1 DUF6057 family protein [Bacteroidales bacterium]MDD5733763.1 DUF6057 family protein [Bacteroidales bacterium]